MRCEGSAVKLSGLVDWCGPGYLRFESLIFSTSWKMLLGKMTFYNVKCYYFGNKALKIFLMLCMSLFLINIVLSYLVDCNIGEPNGQLIAIEHIERLISLTMHRMMHSVNFFNF